MKIKIYITTVLAATMFAACNSDNSIQPPYDQNKEFTIIAKLPEKATTRLIASDDSEGSNYSMKFDWKETDKVNFYYVEKDASWTSDKCAVASLIDGDATFTLGKSPVTSSYIYGCTSTSGINIKASKTSNGSATANFCVDCYTCISTSLSNIAYWNPMFGVVQENSSDTNIPSIMNFQNVCSLLKFTVTLPQGVKRVYTTIGDYDGKNDKPLKTRRNLVGRGSTGTFEFSDKNYSSEHEYENWSSYYTSQFPLAPTDNVLTFYVIMIPQTIHGLSIHLNEGGKDYGKSIHFDSPKVLEPGYMYGVKFTAN